MDRVAPKQTVAVRLPPDAVAAMDRAAVQHRSTRSGWLREVVTRELEADQ